MQKIKIVFLFDAITEPADGLALLGASACVGTVMKIHAETLKP